MNETIKVETTVHIINKIVDDVKNGLEKYNFAKPFSITKQILNFEINMSKHLQYIVNQGFVY